VVDDADADGEVALVGDGHLLAPVVGPVVVARDDLAAVVVVGEKRREPPAEVEPRQVGPVGVEHLEDHVPPALVVRLGRIVAVLVWRAVEVGVVGIGGVVLGCAGVVPPPPGVVERGDDPDPPVAQRVGQVAEDVPPGPAIDGVPVGEIGVPHRETVVVDGSQAREVGAGLGTEIRPRLRIEVVAVEVGNELPVAVFRGRPVRLDVVLVGLGALAVHVPGVPLAVVGGHGVRSPVEVDAEGGVGEPLRHGSFECLPGRGIGICHVARVRGESVITSQTAVPGRRDRAPFAKLSRPRNVPPGLPSRS
jgi:hypothetical protein